MNNPRTVIAGIRGQGLFEITIPTDDTVAAWSAVTYDGGEEVLNPSVRSFVALPSGEVLIGTINAGAYRLGEAIDVDRLLRPRIQHLCFRTHDDA